VHIWLIIGELEISDSPLHSKPSAATPAKPELVARHPALPVALQNPPAPPLAIEIDEGWCRYL